MRRLTALLLLFTLLCPLAAPAEEGAPTFLGGRWETSTEETLCASILYLMYNGQYRLISQGMTTEGVYRLKGETLTLTGSDGHVTTCTCDIAAVAPRDRFITFPSGTRLYPCIDVDFQALSFASPDYTGHFDILLLRDNRFMLHYYRIGDTHPALPEGSALLKIGEIDYNLYFGAWLPYDTHLLLTTDAGDVWELPFAAITGVPVGTGSWRYVP